VVLNAANTVAEDLVGDSTEKDEFPCVLQDFARSGDAGNKVVGDADVDDDVNLDEDGEASVEGDVESCIVFTRLDCVFGVGTNGKNGEDCIHPL
jgi:hypothetical protein